LPVETFSDRLLEAMDSAAQQAGMDFVDDLIANTKEALLEDDSVAAIIAASGTNAWEVDYVIDEVSFAEDEDVVIVSLSFTAMGDQKEDQAIHGTAIALIDEDENVTYEVGEDEEDDEDEE